MRCFTNVATMTLRTLLPATTLLFASCARSSGPPVEQGSPSRPPDPPSDASEVKSAGPDVFVTSAGPLKVTPIFHATVMFEFAGKTIVVDPWKAERLTAVPKATHIFITDIHPDHLDKAAIEAVRAPNTVFVAPKAVAEQLPGLKFTVLANGETKNVDGISVEAVAMYNLQRGPAPGQLFHDKGRGNGYVLGFGDKRVYISGDTECTPEMRALSRIDVAFVCMNLPYTMPPAEAAACTKAFRPAVVYPYHYKGSDTGEFKAALAGDRAIEVRLRNWY